MNFRLLGPVEVDIGDQLIDLGARKQRLVLAVLLLEANRLVPLERLVHLLWPASPPRSARSVVHTLVYRLRRVLTRAGAPRWGVCLVTAGSGYLLRVEPMRVDAHRFRDLVRRANGLGDDRRRAAVLNEALRLWRGPALAGVVDGPAGSELREGLEESRLSAQEDRLDAELRMGLHAEVLEEITYLAERHPYRERLVGQLMLALHHTGRTAQAVQVFTRTRQRLAVELGIGPGTHLRRLHESIVRGGAAPSLPGGPAAHPVPPAPPAATGGAHLPGGPAPDRRVPAQLPAPVAAFTGRDSYLAHLDALLCGPGEGGQPDMPICVITGIAGVGKTALAVSWAQRRQARFPDGQIYLDLRGHHAEPPLDAKAALGRCLRALALPADQVPESLDERAALYRSMLAGTRMLVVLDNAASPAQVRPLLPGGRGCAVVVSSRHQLGGLVARDGAHRVALAPLSPAESHALLSRLIGPDRVGAELTAAAELATLCGRLPLALRIAAANLARQPHQSIAEHVAELRGADRLDRLRVGDDREAAVAAAFDLSYQESGPKARRLFRLLGLVPGPDFTVEAAAALAGAPPEPVRALLDQLVAAHLVEPRPADRYGFHDLLRLYAADRAAADEDGPRARLARRRLFAWYLRAADAAVTLLIPWVTRITRPGELQEGAAPRFADQAAALSWLDAERVNLVALVQHLTRIDPRLGPWHLADALHGYFWSSRNVADWLAAAEAGLRAAEQWGDRSAQGAMHRTLGLAHQIRHDHARAHAHYRRALELHRECADPVGELADLNNLGVLYQEQGMLHRAARCYERGLDVARTRPGQVACEMSVTANLGIVWLGLGRLTAAAQIFASRREEDLRNGNPTGAAHSTGNLGIAYLQLGRLGEAVDCLAQALAAARRLGHRQGVVTMLTHLACAYRELGRRRDALARATEALARARDLGDPRLVAEAHNALGAVYAARRRQRVAAGHYAAALGQVRRAVWWDAEVTALLGLAVGHAGQRRLRAALTAAERALALAEGSGMRVLEGCAHTAIALAHLRRRRHDRAAEHAGIAAAIGHQTGHRLGCARALEVQGRALCRLGEGARAAASWQQAHTLLLAAGSPRARHLRVLLERAGGRPTGTVRSEHRNSRAIR